MSEFQPTKEIIEMPERVGGSAALATTGEGQTIRSAILELARDPAFDVAKLQALTAMQERAEDRQAQKAFAADMAEAQAEMQPVVRAAEVKLGEGKGSYKYASLDGIDEMLRPVMTKHGFSVTYDRTARTGDGGGFIVTGTLRHREGHSITASFPLSLDSGPGRSNAQAAGSTDSYGRKYILLGFFNIIRKNEDTQDGGGTGGQYIDDKEIAVLEDLMVKTQTNPKDFFRIMVNEEIHEINEVQQKDFARLANALQRKQRQMASKKESTNAEGS